MLKSKAFFVILAGLSMIPAIGAMAVTDDELSMLLLPGAFYGAALAGWGLAARLQPAWRCLLAIPIGTLMCIIMVFLTLLAVDLWDIRLGIGDPTGRTGRNSEFIPLLFTLSSIVASTLLWGGLALLGLGYRTFARAMAAAGCSFFLSLMITVSPFLILLLLPIWQAAMAAILLRPAATAP